MNKCHVCNSIEFKIFVQDVFDIEGKPFCPKEIPANVCFCCGENFFRVLRPKTSVAFFMEKERHKNLFRLMFLSIMLSNAFIN